MAGSKHKCICGFSRYFHTLLFRRQTLSLLPAYEFCVCPHLFAMKVTVELLIFGD